MRSTRFWNNLHQVRSKSKDWKAKKFKVLGAIQPKGLKRKPKLANILNISNKPCNAELTTGRVIPSGINCPPQVEVCSSTNKKDIIQKSRQVCIKTVQTYW